MNTALSAEIRRLSPTEKLQLMEKLWHELLANEGRPPTPPRHPQFSAEEQVPDHAESLGSSSSNQVTSGITRAEPPAGRRFPDECRPSGKLRLV